MRAAFAIAVGALGVLVAGQPAASRDAAAAQAPAPCKVITVGGATVHVYCGPAKATVKFGGKTLTFKGGRCGIAGGGGIKGWGLGIGKYTVPPAKPKFRYFGVAYIGTVKAGTYKSGEFIVTFYVPGKTYTVVGSPVVKVTKGGKKGTFSGRLNGPSGPPASGSWRC
jgi:hypothetical protein